MNGQNVTADIALKISRTFQSDKICNLQVYKLIFGKFIEVRFAIHEGICSLLRGVWFGLNRFDLCLLLFPFGICKTAYSTV